MKDQKAADLRTSDGGLPGEIMIHLLNTALHQIVDRIIGGELLIRSVGEVAPLRPVADGVEVDVDKGGDKRTSITECDCLFDVGEEFELVLDEFRGEQLTAFKPADIPGAVEDLELAVAVEEPGIAGVNPAVWPLCLDRRRGVLVIAVEGAGTAEQDLAVIGDMDLDILDWGADGVGFYRAVLLDAQKDRAFGHPVELLQIDTERAVEDEQIGPDRLASGICDPHLAEPEGVFQRSVDQHTAEPIKCPINQSYRMPVKDRRADAFCDIEKVTEQLSLGPAGVFYPDHDLRQDVLEDPRRRKEKGGAELTQIGHDSRLRFRAGDAKACAIGLCVGENMLADPCHRQIGEHLLAVGQALEFYGVLRGRDNAVKGQNDALWASRRPRRVKDDRDVAAPPLGDLVAEKLLLASAKFAATLLHGHVITKIGLS